MRHRRGLLGWLLLGIALRLFLLPIAGHADLVVLYDRVGAWTEGEYQLADFSFQALPMMLHGAYAVAFGIPLPDLGLVHWPPAEETFRTAHAAALSEPTSMLAVALWKLPYLVLDLLAAWLATRLVPGRWKRAVFAMWMLHPVLLFATGVFGKYEVLMLVPLLIGLRSIRDGKLDRGFLWVGIAAAMRLYPWLIVPPMILVASSEPRRRLELLALTSAPLLAIGIVCALRAPVAWVLVPAALIVVWHTYTRFRGEPGELLFLLSLAVAMAAAVPSFAGVMTNEAYPTSPVLYHASYLFSNPFGVDAPSNLLLFPLAWLALTVWAHVQSRAGGRSVPDDVLDFALLSALAFFALAFFHPQYSALLVALVLARIHRLQSGLAAHALQVVGLLLFLFHFTGGHTTTAAFAPLAPEPILDMPGLRDVLPPALGGLPVAKVGSTLLLVAAVWMLFDLVRVRRGELVSARPRLSPGWWAALLAWPAALALFLSFLPTHEVVRESIARAVARPGWAPDAPVKTLGFDAPPVPAEATYLQLGVDERPGDPSSARLELTPLGAPGGGAPLRFQVPAASLAPTPEARVRIPLGRAGEASGLESGGRLRMEVTALPTPGPEATPALRLYTNVRGAVLLDEARKGVRARVLAPGDGLPAGTWLGALAALGLAGLILVLSAPRVRE